jgi:nitrogen regulatory protein PII
MEHRPDQKEFDLICIIINIGLGSKVIKIARKNGVTGATILLGRGTIQNRFLELLGLSDIRKEIVLMIAERTTAYHALEALDQVFKFDKPHHGIAFTTSIKNFFGSHNFKPDNIKENRGVENPMYNAIFVVVDRGNAEDVIEAAEKAGSRGGTIINARGSGIHETSKLFAMEIEPEKEIVLILAENTTTDAIVSSIRENMNIDEPGKGIIFVQEINKTYGLY